MTHMRNHQGLSNRKRAKSESGFVLITSYILIAGLLTTVFSYFSRSFYDFDLAQRRLSRLQALYTAESGAERAVDWMKTNTPTLQPDCGQANPDAATPYSNTSLGTEGTYTVRITNDCNQPNRIYWIRSTGTFDNVTREVRVSVRLDNLANYALASDHMDPDTYFSGANVKGPVHINGPIQIYGEPTFFGRVSSSASEIYYYNNNTAADGYTPTGGEGSKIVFGKERTESGPSWYGDPPYPLLNQPRIVFPSADVSSLKQKRGTETVNNKTWIRFNADGTYNYSTRGPITESNLGSIRSMPPKGTVMYFEPASGSPSEPAVVVRGTIDRDITIASSKNIGIDGSLTYNCNTRTVFSALSDDQTSCRGATDPKLTVVSAKNIIHLPEAEPVQLTPAAAFYGAVESRALTGAFMALGGGMTVPDPQALDSSLGRVTNYTAVTGGYNNRSKEQLRIFGSLIEHEIKPKQLLLGGYDGTMGVLFTSTTGFGTLRIVHDRRLDLASLPTSMRRAMSILSWEACDGSCG